MSIQPKRFRRKSTLEDMSPDMQRLLIHCTSRGVHPREFEGDTPVWSTDTRRLLERHGLIHLGHNAKGKDLWRATDDGRRVVAADVPKLLMPIGRTHRPDYETLPNGRVRFKEIDRGPLDVGYTSDPRQSLWNEPEAA